MQTQADIAAIVVAAGRGERMGGPVPKQFQTLAGKSVLARSVERMAGHPAVGAVVVVAPPGREAEAAALLPAGARVVAGGATRGASVVAGLDAVPEGTRAVLIHDAARPLVPGAVVARVIAALDTAPGAAPGLPLTDALWREDAGRVAAGVPRAGLWRAQTPQGFHLAAIRAAHAASDGGAADDVEVARAAGIEVRIVAGDPDNIKLTAPEDMARAERLLARAGAAAPVPIRVGTGYDVHRFGPGAGVVLCGVTVPHDRALAGHSDADVGMHAVTDAIYGALAEGDIGRHFPPSDPRWKGAASEIFLRHAVGLAAARGYRIGHVDCTLICERPKIGPHAEAMRAALAGIMDVAAAAVGVKATTSERLGFTGREEGIAALATATLVAT